MDELKARKEVLKLNTKLNNDKIKLEKEKKEYAKLVKNDEDANKAADQKGADFSDSKNAEQNAKDAKTVAKRMKVAEKASNSLANCKNRITGLEKDIKKSEDRIAKLNEQIEFTTGKSSQKGSKKTVKAELQNNY